MSEGIPATTLFDLCSLVRSKNAGPFSLTFDAMFSSVANYERAKRANAFTPQMLAALYGVEPEEVQVVYHESALALKISMRRPVFQCDPGDSDCYGGQQYVPLLDVPIE
jgi:hypothetical protein